MRDVTGVPRGVVTPGPRLALVWETIAIVVTAIAMAIGLAGIVLPLLPGLWLIWFSALVYGFFAGFGSFGVAAMAFITLVAVAGAYIGVRVPQKSAASVGVPWWGQAISAALAVLGMFLIPIVGAAVGFVIGVVVMQLLQTRTWRAGMHATWITLRSMAIANGLQLVAGFTMVVAWVAWVIAG